MEKRVYTTVRNHVIQNKDSRFYDVIPIKCRLETLEREIYGNGRTDLFEEYCALQEVYFTKIIDVILEQTEVLINGMAR